VHLILNDVNVKYLKCTPQNVIIYMTSYVHDFADEMEAGVTPDVVPAPVADVPDDDTVLVVLVVWLAAVPV